MTEAATESGKKESIIPGAIEPKLWAGKFKTAEEMEEAYNNSAKVYQENQTLKSQLEVATKAPDKYELPRGLSLREAEVKEIEALARKSNLTQLQFETLASTTDARVVAQRQALADSRTAIGEEKITILEDYVKKFYPEKLQSAIMNQLIKDGEAVTDALKHRDQLLNSRAPGMDQAGGNNSPKYDGQTEMMKAREVWKKNPTKANKDKYIALAREVGEARYPEARRGS